MRTCVRMSYVELHAHSAFSFLDGASLPEELALAAVERGHSTLALTDHDTISGSMEFAQAARTFGLKAIHGCELTVDGDRHITLLVRDEHGWRNLCRLLTRARAHTRGTPGRRTIQKPSVSLAALEEHAGGLVCLSGCARHGIRDEPTMRRVLGAFRGSRTRGGARGGWGAGPAWRVGGGRGGGRGAAAFPPPRPHAEPRAGGVGGAVGRA